MCKALVEIEKDAEKKGIRKGIKKGMDQTRKLTRYLLTDGRQEDLLRATTDTIFMEKLLKEYKI